MNIFTTTKLLFVMLSVCLPCIQANKLPTPDDIALYNRVKGAHNIPLPYDHLDLSQGLMSHSPKNDNNKP
jgi:hypothetical protein